VAIAGLNILVKFELDTLEDLVMLEHNLNKQIIVLSQNESIPVVMIYDDYIE
jgi:hypothetical protein